MAKQLKKFCHITKYVQKTDPKLYEILEDLCVLGSFKSKFGNNGTTFIWPSKETISELDKLRYTDNIGQGIEIVLAHIVRDFLPTASTWNAHKDDLPTGAGKLLEIKGVTGNKVTLADGSELEHDDKFKTIRENANEAVWRIVKGSLKHEKYTRPAPKDRKHLGDKPHPKPVTEGGMRHHQQMRRLYGGIVAAAQGGGPQEAPPCYGYFVALHNAAEQKYKNGGLDKGTYNELCIYMCSYMPFTTSIFLHGAQGAVAEFIESLGELKTEPKMFSLNAYKEVVKKSREHLRQVKGIKGGSWRNEIVELLGQAISQCSDESAKALQGIDLHPSFTPDKFTRLNLSRAAEHDILKAMPHEPEFVNDWLNDLNDVVNCVIAGRVDSSPETDRKTEKLGQLVISLLKEVQKFSKGPYAVYPLGDNAESTSEAERAIVEKLFISNGLADLLAKLTQEQLSDLFTNYQPAESN